MSEESALIAARVAWGMVAVDHLSIEELRTYEHAAGRLSELQRLAAQRHNLALGDIIRSSACEVAEIFRRLPACPKGQAA